MVSALLEVRNLWTRFETAEGVVRAVNGVSFRIEPGETLAIVGESGSGKSVSMMSIMGLLPQPPSRVESDGILFKDRDLRALSPSERRKITGREVAMIFQDPMTSLNPVMPIGRQIGESIHKHLGLTGASNRDRVVELLRLVGVPSADDRLGDYPHQFSGGMRQRVMIAMALACNPELLIADEPTTALDVTIQAQILRLVADLRDRLGMAMIWITHDLGVVARLADRVAVMYAGSIVEEAGVQDFYSRPLHPYSQGLLRSLPNGRGVPRARLEPIGGQPPNMLNLPAGCPFVDRCPFALVRCTQEVPKLVTARRTDRDRVACFRWQEFVGPAHAN
jgi:oligopeptide/dipeptide ABC transporter ATP-binding protein